MMTPLRATTFHRYSLPAGKLEPGVKDVVLILFWSMGVPPLVRFSTMSR